MSEEAEQTKTKTSKTTRKSSSTKKAKQPTVVERKIALNEYLSTNKLPSGFVVALKSVFPNRTRKTKLEWKQTIAQFSQRGVE